MAEADMEPFTLVEETLTTGSSYPHSLFNDVVRLGAAPSADHDLSYLAALRRANPDMIVTAIPATNVPLRAFATAGHASCTVDLNSDSFASWRGFVPPAGRQLTGGLGETVHFAKFWYRWGDELFIMYLVANIQYVLKDKAQDEHLLGPSRATDALILAVGKWLGADQQVVWVYDRYWYQDKKLFEEVRKASWDKVILDEELKKELSRVTDDFFSSQPIYEDLGVPWKRGLMFYGPPGNGKTISIKALMHSLLERPKPIPTLYVKAAPFTSDIQRVFSKARSLAPCMLILEDVETIVTQDTRSYFFNELDGLAGNDGLFVVASTNYLDRLDPGLTQRPSRFDRKYLFPLPNADEREAYCKFWRAKLRHNKTVDFPDLLCQPMAAITRAFSFAFLQEAFVASLLELARSETKRGNDDGDHHDLDRYPLWLTFRRQVANLRKEIKDGNEIVVEAIQPSHNASVDKPDDMDTLQRGLDNAHLVSSDAANVAAKAFPQLPQQKYPYLNSAAQDWRLYN